MLNTELSYDSAILLLGTHSGEMKKHIYTQRPISECSQQHYSQYSESGNNPNDHQAVNGWAKCDIHTILFCNKKKPSIDTCHSTDKPQKHYAQWKKPDTKENILCDFIDMKCSDWANLQKVD